MKARELKDNCCNIRDPLIKKREIFTKRLLPRHPPVLGNWFKKTFPDAQVLLQTLAKKTSTVKETFLGMVNCKNSLYKNNSRYIDGRLHSRIR